jgi:hypothetical protein
MSETFSPEAISTFIKQAELVHEAVAAYARRIGLVEVELVVGEEPEEGVEFEVMTSDFAGVALMHRPSLVRKLTEGAW